MKSFIRHAKDILVKIISFVIYQWSTKKRCHDTQYNDTKYNNIAITLSVIMPSVAFNILLCWMKLMLSVIVLNVVMLSVVAPKKHGIWCELWVSLQLIFQLSDYDYLKQFYLIFSNYWC